ncbi:MAG: helix-turn-helix transcriptional regulator [Halofilum sp. (in: g-proteobacteria)]|nr:helix-turn-helix transcriptional regulator [Halofilum sp. (in: g-proteobacteria)]
MPDLMTTHEVAEYLRLKERKIYELVRQGAIPCTRVTGKWLFPRQLIDFWLLEHADGAGREALATPAPVVAGSHDPLLEWAVQASGCGLALLFGGSMDGLARFARAEAAVSGLHVPAPGDGGYNVDAVRRATRDRDLVLIEWARRRQGLMLAPGNPLGIGGLADVARTDARVIDRQPGAGSRLLLERLLADAGIEREQLALVEEPAVNENDVAREVHAGHADTGVGIESAALEAGLDFVPLGEERFDLLVGRREYFEPAFQSLLALTRTRRFAERARTLGGYDVSATGTVRYNAP